VTALPDLASLAAIGHGVRLYEDARYWDAHEAWEEVWRAELHDRPERARFVQGLIQLAAALHKLFVMRGPLSAERLFARSHEKLAAYADGYEGFAVAPLVAQIEACRARLARGETLTSADVPRVLRYPGDRFFT
jgi:predicted metal-dependent hydrolase